MDSLVPKYVEFIAKGEKVVLLLTGGLDSFIGYHWLKHVRAHYKPAYFDLGSRYSPKELFWIMNNPMKEHIEVDRSLSWLGKFESGENAFVPYRNLYLAMTASLKYADNVMICGVKGDMVEDKSPMFFENMSLILSELHRKQIRIFSPFWGVTKSQLVKWYLTEYTGPVDDLKATVSCYSSQPTMYCGKCKACFRKFVALAVNGIDIKFENQELARQYFEDANSGKYDQERAADIIFVCSKMLKLS